MPEIKNEIPTDEELQAYLAEASVDLLLSWKADDYKYREFGNLASQKSTLYLLESPIWRDHQVTAKACIFKALKRLNEVSRDDPFWINTNRRPTIYKLPDHCRRILKGEPDDVSSLFTLTLFTTLAKPRNQLWIRLYRLQAVSLELVAFDALYLLFSTVPSSQDFAAFVLETGTTSEALPILADIRANGGTLFFDWAGQVNAALLTS